MFLVGRVFHCSSLFVASDFLHSDSMSLLTYLFFLMAFSSAVFLTLQSGWSALRLVSKKQVCPSSLSAVARTAGCLD